MAEHSPAAGGKASYTSSVPRSYSHVLPSPGTTEWELSLAWPEPASLWVYKPARETRVGLCTTPVSGKPVLGCALIEAII